jgi:hypothetical protein
VHHRPVLPTTPLGWVGFTTAILAVVNVALVNVIQVPFLGIGLLVATAAAAALARFVQHDRSVVVLAVVLASAAALLGWLLFLGGEVLIGHD